ncbi:hypothetical protein PUNSTDRAFT_133039 [Punctularia strigosozonata HHB-11173 SS5]|uniref:uncharacterized protein n=1 Tax=Punctularia strigosozonata (strain HHB-11173) TaxID=741275 RepID=UPI0004416620|nr:uncharacterized protein PUNSTDRAFT_133039 [Punctularia strigosozonata HHB-11173 SS5]EIN10975.1 hypothetical protein PUNSTDRAFT_133039 [Punctularia strigosozonata HHB-11173 SS5]
MLNRLVYKPNRILEKQKFFQAAEGPIYRRLPRASLYLNVTLAGFALGSVGSLYGIYKLIAGESKE